jgi:hypothetical protein
MPRRASSILGDKVVAGCLFPKMGVSTLLATAVCRPAYVELKVLRLLAGWLGSGVSDSMELLENM